MRRYPPPAGMWRKEEVPFFFRWPGRKNKPLPRRMAYVPHDTFSHTIIPLTANFCKAFSPFLGNLLSNFFPVFSWNFPLFFPFLLTLYPPPRDICALRTQKPDSQCCPVFGCFIWVRRTVPESEIPVLSRQDRTHNRSDPAYFHLPETGYC